METWITVLVAALWVCRVSGTQSEDDDFDFTNGALPDPFLPHQHYPDRPESVECRPIRLRIDRGSRRFSTDLVTNDHANVQFAHSDARIMSNRLQRRLNDLAEQFYDAHGVWITVTKAWTDQDDEEVTDELSLHYEGRTVRVTVAVHLFSPLLQLAVHVGFDWVYYTNESYARLSVIPDSCDTPLDMVFMLDRSGSVGLSNFTTAIDFLQNVITFYTIASNATQIGLVTFSTGATIEFDLNDFSSTESVLEALGDIIYTRGWTATALALALTRRILDPTLNYGAREFSDGIPKVAVLLTDGRSNQIPITRRANALRNFGVQVYTVGIGEIYLPELKFIASDPDSKHVFQLRSFTDAASFVDLLSFTTCDTPAVVEPGEDTRTEIEEEEFRFFQSKCAAFSQTIMIEQIDLVGRCWLYASWSVQNPGPLDPPDTVVRNEDQTATHRSLHLSLPHNQDPYVYISVLGKHKRNKFSIVIWDMIFEQDEYTIQILDGGDTTGRVIIRLVEEIGMTEARFTFVITSGNENGLFALDQETGVLSAAAMLPIGMFQLNIVAQNREHACHRSKVVITVVVMEETIEFSPLPQPVNVSEATIPGTIVTQLSANTSGSSSPTYAIIAGNVGNAFAINSSTGEISVASALNFETLSMYELTVQASSPASLIPVTAELPITILDANEPPIFVTVCALNDSCTFTVPENEPPNFRVGVVQASDPDTASPNNILLYSLEPVSVPFQISGPGLIETTGPLDFENTPSYNFTVVVQDGGIPPSPRLQTQVIVNVMNVEDNRAPVFLSDCSVQVFELIAVGSPFLACPASDIDEDGNVSFDLVYEIVAGNINNTFRIDPNMGAGVIVTDRPLDREEIDLFTLTLTATDDEGLTGNITFQIVVLDVNDSPPTCTAPVNPVIIAPEELPNSGLVATFTAVDPDLNPVPPIYSLESQVINPQANSTMVTVRVTDGANPDLSSTCTLTIQFEDRCLEQDYSINPSTGQLSIQFLCSARINPDLVELTEGGSRRVICEAIANVPLTHRFLHNGTAITEFRASNELILFRVNFDDSGEYICQARNNILGTINSSPATLNILVAAEIAMPPTDTMVTAGESVTLQCIASGIPDPDIAWFRPGDVMITAADAPRFVVIEAGLRISDARIEDVGEYTCEASNLVDTVRASAQLTVFEVQQLVAAEVPQYYLPSPDKTCHEFNTSDFNSLMTSITKYNTITTAQYSDDLCPPSTCNPAPCQNKGVCVSDPLAMGDYTCQCPLQYTGTHCETVVDPCTKTPCLHGGLCASTARGRHICSCLDSYHGDRCQYTDVCINDSVHCPPDEMCLETVVTSEGYVCVKVEGEEEEGGEGLSVTVEGGRVGSLSMTSELDGEVNFYIEMSEDVINRRRRRAVDEDMLEDNGFVTVCEARFIPSPSGALNTFLLVWACPMGVASPDGADEVAICELLIEERLVTSCTSRDGGTVELVPVANIPPTAVDIVFLLLHPSTDQPLSAADTLAILRETDALTKLNTTIYRTVRFSAVSTPEGNTSPTNDDGSGRIAGAVLGSIAAVIIVTVVLVTVVCVVRWRKSHKINNMEHNAVMFQHQQNGNGTMTSVTFSNHYTPIPLKEPSTKETQSQEQKPEFDDPVYSAGFTSSSYRPPSLTRKKSSSLESGMRSSLERGMKLIKDKMAGTQNSDSTSGKALLSSTSLDDSTDYDDIAPPLSSQTTPTINSPPDQAGSHGDEEIYANMQHQQRVGATGNAGERWESYWKSKTLLRTNNMSVSDDLARK